MELYCHAREKTENIFLYFFTELKTYHLSYSIYKHEAIDFADPRSMQDACHINFVMDLALRRVCGSVVELGALRFVSSWGIFSFSHAREKTENIFLYFFTKLKTNHLSYSILKHRIINLHILEIIFYKFAYGYLFWEYQCPISNAFFRRLMFAINKTHLYSTLHLVNFWKQKYLHLTPIFII